jgi:hypothetical protein
MICEKCGGPMDFGRQFPFCGGKDLGEHKFTRLKGNVSVTYTVQGKRVDENFTITLCNRCMGTLGIMKKSDWGIFAGMIIMPIVFLMIISFKFPRLASYWVALIAFLPVIIGILLYVFRKKKDSRRTLKLNDLELENEIMLREKNSGWVGNAYTMAISAKFAKANIKVTPLNGGGWTIEDPSKHAGCNFAYVYLSKADFAAFMAKNQ